MRDIFRCTYQQTLGNLHLLKDAVYCSEANLGGKSVVRNRDTIVQSAMSGFMPHLVLVFIIPNTSIKQGKLIAGLVVL